MNHSIQGTIAALGRVEKGIARGILQDAVKAAGEPILATARELCPVRTGKLRASLRMSVRKFRESKGDVGADAVVECGGRAFTGEEFYGLMVEFGHVVGKRMSGNAGHDGAHLERALAAGRSVVPPKPFIRPAFARNKDLAENTAMEIIWVKLNAEFMKA